MKPHSLLIHEFRKLIFNWLKVSLSIKSLNSLWEIATITLTEKIGAVIPPTVGPIDKLLFSPNGKSSLKCIKALANYKKSYSKQAQNY